VLSSRHAPRRRIRSSLHGCALVVIAVATQACLVVSLQPAYDAASVAFDDPLLGRWQNAADQTSATVERAEWRAYKIAYTDRFATLTFHANLTRIGPASFLDLTQVRGSDEGPYLIPVHGVLRVNADAETLTVEALTTVGFYGVSAPQRRQAWRHRSTIAAML